MNIMYLAKTHYNTLDVKNIIINLATKNQFDC